ncbi:MAG: type II toxin-antitoxin system RelE/ParE family toxin [Candidatus Solibacter usitatus]|nr:type II toxin-antitoxin system RelE/ParE family toxin [Candidatus Solibacter usitatus]
MRIRWAYAAASDLAAIRDYLREQRPSLMQSTIRKLYDTTRSLKKFPNRGRIGRLAGTRELVLSPMPYIVVYSVEHEVVHILRLIHASEDWP